MALSYCWSRRSPVDHAELIHIALSGWNVSQYDYSRPLRTRVDSDDLADSGGPCPSLQKVFLFQNYTWKEKYVMTTSISGPWFLQRFPRGRMGQHPHLFSARLCGRQSILEGGRYHTTCLCQWNMSVLGWMLYELAPAPFFLPWDDESREPLQAWVPEWFKMRRA